MLPAWAWVLTYPSFAASQISATRIDHTLSLPADPTEPCPGLVLGDHSSLDSPNPPPQLRLPQEVVSEILRKSTVVQT